MPGKVLIGNNSNTSQPVFKSIVSQPQEFICVNIAKIVNVGALKDILKGVSAFTDVFNPEDIFMLEVKVVKILDITEPEGMVKQDGTNK